jgi:protein disulfide-isomerase-like protein
MLSFLLLLSLVDAKVIDLNPTNWETYIEKSEKPAFVKFFAPWCGHCKKMKPDWDKLGELFRDDANVLIGDVDCTGNSKSLCEKYNVKGYPTLKTFWKTASDDYSGGRGFEELKEFASNLKPLCVVQSMENCSEEEKNKIQEFQTLNKDEAKKKLLDLKDAISEAEIAHDNLLKSLQDQFSKSKNDLETLKKESKQDVEILEVIVDAREDEANGATKNEL